MAAQDSTFYDPSALHLTPPHSDSPDLPPIPFPTLDGPLGPKLWMLTKSNIHWTADRSAFLENTFNDFETKKSYSRYVPRAYKQRPGRKTVEDIVYLDSCQQHRVLGKGTVTIDAVVGDDREHLPLTVNNVYYVPSMGVNGLGVQDDEIARVVPSASLPDFMDEKTFHFKCGVRLTSSSCFDYRFISTLVIGDILHLGSSWDEMKQTLRDASNIFLDDYKRQTLSRIEVADSAENAAPARRPVVVHGFAPSGPQNAPFGGTVVWNTPAPAPVPAQPMPVQEVQYPAMPTVDIQTQHPFHAPMMGDYTTVPDMPTGGVPAWNEHAEEAVPDDMTIGLDMLVDDEANQQLFGGDLTEHVTPEPGMSASARSSSSLTLSEEQQALLDDIDADMMNLW